MLTQSWNHNISEFYQKSKKSFAFYYKRIIIFISKIKVKDRFIFISNFTLFSFLESIIFDQIFRIFIRNLNDQKIWKKIIRDIIFVDRSLKNIYNLTKKIRRINLEIQKLLKKKFKSKKFRFYKNFVEKNLFKQKIVFLFIFFRDLKTKTRVLRFI